MMINKIIPLLLCGLVSAQQTGKQALQSATAATTQQSRNSASNYTGSLNFLAELETQAEATNNVERAADQYMQKKSWRQGLNDNGFYVAKGVAAIMKSPTDSDYELARALAFQSAMSDAKRSIANYYGQEVQTCLQNNFDEPGTPSAEQNQSAAHAGIDGDVLSKLTDLAQKKLQQELGAQDVAPHSTEYKQIVAKVLSSTSVTSAIQRSATHQVGGLVVSKIFEQDGEIAVVAYYSPNTLSLAAAINGHGTIPKARKRAGKSISQWAHDLKLADLYLSQGVQVTTDKEGNIVLISYGLSTARSSSTSSKRMAQNKSEVEAIGHIRRFAGEIVVTSDAKRDAIKAIEYDDGSNQTVSEVESSISSRISQVADRLNIPGIVTLRDWSITDPRSNTIICGTVCMWSTQSGGDALKAKDSVQDLLRPNGGFKQKPEVPSTAHSPHAEGHHYSSESPEGEDL